MRHAIADLINSLCSLLCCAAPTGLIVWLVVWLVGRSRIPPPDPTQCAWQLTRMRQAAEDTPSRLLRVLDVYQSAQRGSKAFVEDPDTGERFDSWFWWYHAEAGSLVLCAGSFGHGDHLDRRVLYVGDEDAGPQVFDQMTAAQLWAAHSWGNSSR